MSFSRKVSLRLYSEFSRERAVAGLPIPQLLLHQNKLNKNRKSNSVTTILSGITLTLIVSGQFALQQFQLKSDRNVSLVYAAGTGLIFIFLLIGIRLLIWQPCWTMMEVSCQKGSQYLYGSALIHNAIYSMQAYFTQMEDNFLKLKKSTSLITQIIFFVVCQKVLLTHQPVASLYTLMFFNVITYCISYIQELIEREDWNMYVQVTRNSQVRHLAMSATNIVLEWTKAVVFIITVVCILLVFGLEKGLKNYTPSLSYLIITGIYFMITEKVFIDIISKFMDWMKLDYFENMECLYIPVILKSSQILLSLFMTVPCVMMGYVNVAIASVLTNVRLKYRELDGDDLLPLRVYLIELSNYRVGTPEEVNALDDVCAVCLQKMTIARVTPCQHFFHANCLRRALHESAEKCPICQHSLPLTNSLKIS